MNEFYAFENSKRICKEADALFNKKFDEIIEEKWGETDRSEYKEIDMNELAKELFMLMIDRITIGEPETLKIKDELVVNIFTKMVDDLSGQRSSFLNMISFGMIAKWKLTPNLSRTFKKYLKSLEMVKDIMRKKI